MRRTLSWMALAGLVAAPAAQAQDAAVFQPTGNWTADYGEDYCRLIRTFSDGKDEVSLALERTQPGDSVRLIFVGDAIKTFRGASEIGYQFLPAGAAAKATYVRSQTVEGRQFLSFDPVTLAPFAGFGPPGAAGGGAADGAPAGPPPYDRAKELETARGISAISLADGLTSPVRIETGALRAPIAAMQARLDDLLKVWGLDPEKHKTMTAVARLEPRDDGVLPQGTIPFTEFAKFGGGANQVRLLIGADGKPSDCAIYSPSLSETLNARICELALQRASFVPAKDGDGQAMASYWMGSPMFLGPPLPFGRGR